ncbi:cinnamycin family lantibiotic [Nocardiopsis sediminis]|uniref:Cinnamycin family lantibiotic n=1 Tax=Nocardiopsis sediminis TaxID=1778267 RepID=A0ABV8FJ31_9ACTN
MSTTMILHQAAVDDEFRSAVLADPAAFGVAATDIPAGVAQQDQEALDAFTDSIVANEVYACGTTCSFGPATILCDGSTKS